MSINSIATGNLSSVRKDFRGPGRKLILAQKVFSPILPLMEADKEINMYAQVISSLSLLEKRPFPA